MALFAHPTRKTTVPAVEGRVKATVWGLPFLLGLLLFAGGIFCFIAAGVTGLASILLFGGLLLAGGVLEIIRAFKERGTRQFLPHLLAGLLTLVVGGLFLARPLVGLAAVTLLLAGYFFASGLFRTITSVLDRYEGWGWDLFSGVVSLLLGVVVFSQWPISSLWVVGVLIAVELVMRGAATMAGALALRRVLRTVAA
ncbi:MAG: DUF308 domain-containing protein [Myxococcaceae bacterium]|nr:DUF308 domain-containing protein [Myxococcaceae bacterium]